MSLNGKVAVVTGASRGIGRAIAIKLAREGADVVINYAGRADAAHDVAEVVRKQGREALVIQADVADAKQVDEMFKATLDKFSRVDILVNNAGIARDGLLLRMKEEDWDAVLDVDLKGAFNCTKAAARSMLKARKGRIINIASVIGLTGNAGQANYSAAKAGLIGFTKSVAKELAARNITVNAVAPGFISTEMTRGLEEKVREEMLSRIPRGRLGTSEDVAALVAFLAQDAADYITGQVIAVDGGMTMM